MPEMSALIKKDKNAVFVSSKDVERIHYIVEIVEEEYGKIDNSVNFTSEEIESFMMRGVHPRFVNENY